MIVPLLREHVDQVARLHCAALTGLLTEPGKPRGRAFYDGCVRAGSATGFVYVNEGKVHGFVLGSTRPDTLKRAVVRANPAGTLAGMFLGILLRPAALAWLLKSFKGPDEGSYDPQSPELTYLAVAAEGRGSGTGGHLVDAFTHALREVGVPMYELSVDDDNAGDRLLRGAAVQADWALSRVRHAAPKVQAADGAALTTRLSWYGFPYRRAKKPLLVDLDRRTLATARSDEWRSTPPTSPPRRRRTPFFRGFF